MLAEQFAASLYSLGPYSSSPHFAIALSGGADSLALTLLAQQFVAQHGGRITALTVDHRLREESTKEAQRVAAMMRARNIEHHILTPSHNDTSSNLQEKARNWRYDALRGYCHANGILHCLLAHNVGDNRETAHHNIERGDTADGASGMSAMRIVGGVRFLRPLLTTERMEIEQYLHSRNVAWIEDPSNQNMQFARVRTRQMLQQDTTQRATLDATIRRESAARAQRDHALAAAAIHCVSIHPLGYAEIDLTAWRQLDAAVARQLLADCIVTISGATTRPRRHDIERLMDALGGDFTSRTLQHCELTLKQDCLRIAREPARVAKPVMLEGSGELIWDGRFRVRYDLPTALTLGALGTKGCAQLKAKWPQLPALPRATPALFHLDELLFVPHIEESHPRSAQVTLGFTPPKPLAAAPFWCLNLPAPT